MLLMEIEKYRQYEVNILLQEQVRKELKRNPISIVTTSEPDTSIIVTIVFQNHQLERKEKEKSEP